MAVSPRLPRSIQESVGSCSPSPSVRWPFANLVDPGVQNQISSLKRCEQERQKLEYQIHALDRRIERFDERLERLQVEAKLSDDKLTKCVAEKVIMEQDKAELDKIEKDLFEEYDKLKTQRILQNSQTENLAAQIQTLQTENKSISNNLQRAYQKFKVLQEENEIMQKMAEDRNCLLPIKKRNTSSANERMQHTSASDK